MNYVSMASGPTQRLRGTMRMQNEVSRALDFDVSIRLTTGGSDLTYHATLRPLKEGSGTI